MAAVDLRLGPGEEDALTLGRFAIEIGRRWGERTAVVFEDRRITYRELVAETRTLARALVAAGVGKGTKVALLMPDRPEWITSAFAVGMSGGVLVPLNTFSTADDVEYVLRHSDTQLLLLQPALLKHRFLGDLLEAHPLLRAGAFGRLADPALPFLRGIVSLGPGADGAWSWERFRRGADGVNEGLLDRMLDDVRPSDDAMIVYTSGTTDRPKGVLHAHRAPCIQFWRWVQQLRLEPDDRVWSTFPYFWTAGFSMVMGGTLAAGATLVMQETFDAGTALELIERERVTTIHLFAAAQGELLEHPTARTRDLSSLRRLMRDSPLRQLPSVKPLDWDPGAAYGLSETFTICTSIPSDSPAEARATTHGRPLPGMHVRIVDERGAPLPAGQTGEIAVKGVTAMRGYYKVDPEETFDTDGYFHTKDAGYLDRGGFLHWHGRLSGLIKTSGANVSPVEVETALMRWGRLRAAGVVGVAHPTLGEAVVACVVRRADDAVTEDEVRAHLRGALASYKVPRRVLFFADGEIELTGSQKIKLGELRDLAAARLARDDAEPAWRDHLAGRAKAVPA